MTDPKLTKLRILKERAKKKLDKSQKEYSEIERMYVFEMKSAGFCPCCSKLLSECECIILGEIPSGATT